MLPPIPSFPKSTTISETPVIPSVTRCVTILFGIPICQHPGRIQLFDLVSTPWRLISNPTCWFFSLNQLHSCSPAPSCRVLLSLHHKLFESRAQQYVSPIRI
jgi:hypothetical protein